MAKTAINEMPAQKEFETVLDEAQAWAASVGYKEEDVDNIIRAVRRRKHEHTKDG